MNLIADPWIPVIRQDGTSDTIRPYQIVERNNPVAEIRAPRPDFQGALYQFLIGLLQTCFAPEDEDEWHDFWREMPEESELQEAFCRVKHAFELDSPDGINFMQENPTTENHNALFDKAEWLPIEDLIGGALSTNTRKKNEDLFVKAGEIKVVSPYWAALALFNMQVTGVLAWGQHRVGLRGNAPLTTLLVPTHDNSPLWEKLWLNILYEEDLDLLPVDLTKTADEYIFPWIGKTRISTKKKPTSPLDAHPLQHFWAMPRRIIFKIETVTGECDLTGESIEKGALSYKRVPDGVYYTNGWVHPLTPYTRSANDKFPRPVTGENAGEGFRHWLSLNYDEYADEKKSKLRWGRSLIVKHFYDEKPKVSVTKIWCFGYDATNANVKCWYESIIPTFSINAEDIDSIKDHATEMMQLAYQLADKLRDSLVRAWFRPQIDNAGKKKWNHAINAIKKTKHLSSYKIIEFEFWEHLATVFPAILHALIDYGQTPGKPFHLYVNWANEIQRYSLKYFDHNALCLLDRSTDMKRIVEAKKYLLDSLYPKKKSLLRNINEFRKQEEVST